VTHTSRVETKLAVAAAAAATEVTLASTFGLNNGDKITIGAAAHTVALVKPGAKIDITPALAAAAIVGVVVKSVEFDILIERLSGGVAIETELFTGLSLNAALANYAPRLIGSCATDGTAPSETGDSQMIRLFKVLDTRPDAGVFTLTGGTDGVVDDTTYVGNPSENPVERTGLQALANEPGISLVAIPGNTSVTVPRYWCIANSRCTALPCWIFRWVRNSPMPGRIGVISIRRGVRFIIPG
jgi:uncharacterized protein